MEFGFDQEFSLDGRSRTYSGSARALRHRRCPARTMIGFQEVSRSRQKRQVLQGMVRPLKRWLVRHRDNPYPTRAEKIALALGSKMTLVQVSNWFANARRRLKNTVKTPNVSWAKRVQLYNSCVEGNAELLSISSEDSIWQLDDSNEHERTAVDVASATMANVDHCYSAPEANESHRHSPIYSTSTYCSNGGWLAEKIGEPQAVTLVSPPLPLPPPRPPSRTADQVINLSRCKRSREQSEDEEEDDDVVRVEEDCYDDRPRKYKRSILQRYLHDSIRGTQSNSTGRSPSSVPSCNQTAVHQQSAVAVRKFGDSTGTFSDSDFFTSSHSSTSTSSRSSVDWSRSLSDDEIPKNRTTEETIKTVELAKKYTHV